MSKIQGLRIQLEYFGRLWVVSIRKFYVDRCLSQSASLTLITVISVIPLLIMLAGFFLSFDSIRDIVAQTTRTKIIPFFLPATPSDEILISDYFFEFTGNVPSLSLVAILFLLVAAVDTVFILEDAIEQIWKCKQRKTFLEKLITYWCIITIAPLVIFTSFYISLEWENMLGNVFSSFIIPWIITWIFFFISYQFIHKNKVSIYHASFSALFMSLLWGLAKLGFIFYLSTIGNQTIALLYGSLYLIPIGIGWIYYSYAIFFLGIELTYTLEHPEIYQYPKTLFSEDNTDWNLFFIISSLIIIYKQFEEGKKACPLSLLAKKNQLSQSKMQHILDILYKNNIIQEVSHIDKQKKQLSYLPNLPMEKLSIESIVKLLPYQQQHVPKFNMLSNDVELAQSIFNQIVQLLKDAQSQAFRDKSFLRLYQSVTTKIKI